MPFLCFPVFLIFKIGVLIDETLTRLWKAYKDYPHNVSIIGCVMILISMIPAAFSLPQDLNSNELQVKCSSFEHKSKFFQIFLFSVTLRKLHFKLFSHCRVCSLP